jgi:hypothetical protein
MFEEIIASLQSMDVGFEEMPDQGMLSIEVGSMDKMQLIEVLNMIYSMGMTVDMLDDTAMTVSSGAGATEEPMIEPVEEDDMGDDAQMDALDQALMGM